jgi:hypothetical protein
LPASAVTPHAVLGPDIVFSHIPSRCVRYSRVRSVCSSGRCFLVQVERGFVVSAGDFQARQSGSQGPATRCRITALAETNRSAFEGPPSGTDRQRFITLVLLFLVHSILCGSRPVGGVQAVTSRAAAFCAMAVWGQPRPPRCRTSTDIRRISQRRSGRECLSPSTMITLPFPCPNVP